MTFWNKDVEFAVCQERLQITLNKQRDAQSISISFLAEQ